MDPNLEQLLGRGLRIEKVNAFKTTKVRVIGDIGLRAFFQLYRRAKSIIKTENINFLFITVPSFYVALIGRMLHRSTGIPYGIDYIDPWVHIFPGSERIFSRHWWSTQLAKFLEPMAIKNASLITGVAEGYYQGVLERNPYLRDTCLFGAMPYGGEPEDYKAVAHFTNLSRLFPRSADKFQFVYAGAMLPKAYVPLEKIFQSIKESPVIFAGIQFHFIGTGKHPNDPEGYNIKPLAEKYGLWQSVIFEYPKRLPYLDVLLHLKEADGIFILGSTEPHYTPSKVFQGVLSGRPIMAVLHNKSTAGPMIQQSSTGRVLYFDGENTEVIRNTFALSIDQFIKFTESYDTSNTSREAFEDFSAENSTKKLALLLDEVIKSRKLN